MLVKQKKIFGREKFLTVITPEDFVKVYDGNETPIAYLYNKLEANELFKDFNIILSEPHYFPIRFFKFLNVGGVIHKILDKYCGTLIYYLLEKPSIN